ncbi:hypothetical protein MO867_17420 [Microbulbifer sp. OS29]|uniref:Uncharacterized protein n=1 Tax=Microbulbifer okhotskensis TaxID=2926617 RepID=A0A9X2EQT5_9GAMM|nr:hypothetical protein [Microbulbifer okhotskensis]MCO1336114.1 hypothetical protein [Microbulbifer okhotskensis]
MQDLYRAPESVLENTLPTYRPSAGWKIFFFIMVPLEIYSQYLGFTSNDWGMPIWWLVISLMVYSLFYLALFGLAFAKKIAFPQLWIFYLPVLVLTDIFEFSLLVKDLNMSSLGNQIIVMLYLMLILFTWHIVYKYQKIMRYFT